MSGNISGEYVKIYRIDNQGFYCKPYNSKIYHHSFEFIDVEVKDLTAVNQTIERSKLYKPNCDDKNWSGCFCFLDEYDKNITYNNGVLAMRKGQKVNLSLIPKTAKIWVRNFSHIENTSFYSNFSYPVEHNGKVYWFEDSSAFNSFCWVKMQVDLALERTRLWKETYHSLPEWVTEFYLMESQIEELRAPSFRERFRLATRNFIS